MFGDHPVVDPEQVHESPDNRLACCRNSIQERKSRRGVGADQIKVDRHQLPRGDHVVDADVRIPEIVLENERDLPQSCPALGRRGVVDEVLGHQFEGRFVPSMKAGEILLDNCLRDVGLRSGFAVQCHTVVSFVAWARTRERGAPVGTGLERIGCSITPASDGKKLRTGKAGGRMDKESPCRSFRPVLLHSIWLGTHSKL